MSARLQGRPVLVIGAGIMGAGIAQVAALAGHPVWLFDLRDGAAQDARHQLDMSLQALVTKGRLAPEAARLAIDRIRVACALSDGRDAVLAIEAIAERLDAKRSLLRELEGVLAEDAVLATNTSSLSITALANGLRRPGRVVGMHFFNPVPLMKLVEVISGLHTAPACAEAVFALAVTWGKVPVHAKSTPGFIVNRIARPYYAEALALLQEQALTAPEIDGCLHAAGFRMGPCELMDLIGHDTNFAVTQSVYEANFHDKRFVPSLVQRELVEAGFLGRKSGRGFYVYPRTDSAGAALANLVPPRPAEVIVCGAGRIAEDLAERVARFLGDEPKRCTESSWTGLSMGSARLVLTEGAPAYEVSARTGLADIAVFDRPLAAGGSLAYAMAPGASDAWRGEAPAWLHALGFSPVPMSDAPGLVVARTVAMLINEAADAVLQGVCSSEGADAAMTLGVNYPAGPFEWLSAWSVAGVNGVIDGLDAFYRGERYRVSPWLRRGGGRT